MDSKKEKAAKIIAELKKLFPVSRIALNYTNTWELLVAVVLSAQCTDKMVNKVTEKLFRKYPDLDSYVNADPLVFEQDIKSTGFYRNKAKNVLAAAKIVREKFGGRVPDTMEELITLPGVARKTANVILSSGYGKIEGIAVDTHVRRLSKLLGLTTHDDPVKIEKDLMAVIPREEWPGFTHRLIDYGRQYCQAKRHDHSRCVLSAI